MNKKFCSHCGHQQEHNAQFCSNCGKVSNSLSPSPEVKSASKHKGVSKNFWIAVIIFILLLAIAGYFSSKKLGIGNPRNTGPTESQSTHNIGEAFTLKSGQEIKVEEAHITDKVDSDRSIWLKVSYSEPSLDNLQVALYNSDAKVSDNRYNGGGAMEYKGLSRNDARGNYKLVFAGGDSVNLSDAKYTEVPNDFQYSTSGNWWSPETPQPQPVYTAPEPAYVPPRNLSCNSSDIGSTTYTNCFQY